MPHHDHAVAGHHRTRVFDVAYAFGSVCAGGHVEGRACFKN